MNEQRGNWYLLTGLVLGLVFGLLYSWAISPVKYVDTEPVSLADSYKDEYRRLIALAYQSSGDLGRARERLGLLGADDPIPALVMQAQQMLAEDAQSPEARALALLATNLGRPETAGQQTPATQVAAQITQAPSDTPTATREVVDAVRSPTAPLPTASPTTAPPTASPTITRTPTPTIIPRATATPAPTQSAPFVLKTKGQVCDGSIPAGRLVVLVTDKDGNPVAGVKITVTTQEGQEETFFTGLAPEYGPGYADFQMAAGVIYRVTIGQAGDVVDNLQATGNCGLKVEFYQKD